MKIKLRPHVAFRLHMANVTEDTWFTKDERRVVIRHMRDGHLVNTIRLIRRWAVAAALSTLHDSLGTLLLRPQGEAAQDDALDEELSRLGDPDDYAAALCPCWGRLLDEAEKRGLDASGFFDPDMGRDALLRITRPTRLDDEELEHENYEKDKS